MEAPAPGDWPPISVIMSIRDEERHLTDAVDHVLDQDYPGEVEVVLAVGPSRDRTAEIAADITTRDPRVRVVDNPAGRTPNGLNAAIAAARHGIVVRVDGHGLLPPGYIRRAVEILQETGAANVGGIMQAEGLTDFDRRGQRGVPPRRPAPGLGPGAWHGMAGHRDILVTDAGGRLRARGRGAARTQDRLHRGDRLPSGILSAEQLRALAEPLRKGGYGDYLLGLQDANR